MPPTPRPYTWTRITHVSRSWRAVALGNPLLWTQVVIIERRVTTEIIKRAAGQPLTITAAQATTMETLQ